MTSVRSLIAKSRLVFFSSFSFQFHSMSKCKQQLIMLIEMCECAHTPNCWRDKNVAIFNWYTPHIQTPATSQGEKVISAKLIYHNAFDGLALTLIDGWWFDDVPSLAYMFRLQFPSFSNHFSIITAYTHELFVFLFLIVFHPPHWNTQNRKRKIRFSLQSILTMIRTF